MKTKPTSKNPAKDAPAPVAPDAPRALTAEPWPIDRPKPYERNPRRNVAAVEKVAASPAPRKPRKPTVKESTP